jgi:hypothetical protein
LFAGNFPRFFDLNYLQDYRKKEKNKYLLKKTCICLAAFAFFFFTPGRKDRKDRKKSQKPI